MWQCGPGQLAHSELGLYWLLFGYGTQNLLQVWAAVSASNCRGWSRRVTAGSHADSTPVPADRLEVGGAAVAVDSDAASESQVGLDRRHAPAPARLQGRRWAACLQCFDLPQVGAIVICIWNLGILCRIWPGTMVPTVSQFDLLNHRFSMISWDNNIIGYDIIMIRLLYDGLWLNGDTGGTTDDDIIVWYHTSYQL